MIEPLEAPDPRCLGFKLSGRLHDEDYRHFVPSVEEAVAGGRTRLLAWFHDFHGWDFKALWDDIDFASDHVNDLKRIALVGETRWEKWMAGVCKPFTKAEVRSFDASEIEQAWTWLAED